MPLDEYQRKRDFASTPEPSGAAEDTGGGPLAYTIQKHHARALHYDLRLEWGGVLLSWAVPKGPSLDPHDKRLAVHVEDHPLDYGTFEGEIPAGEYGAGDVVLWDRGTWEPIGDADAGLAKGDLKFVLHGIKLRGAWMLVRLKPKPGEKRDNWLLFKERDDEARPREEYDVLQQEPVSVAGVADDPGGSSGPGKATPATRMDPEPPDPSAIPGAAKTPMPEQLLPSFATLSEHTPQGSDWIHEVKLDGYRALARLEHGRATMLTRAGHDWTDRFSPLARAIEQLPARDAWLDGEVVVFESSGVSSFGELQQSLSSETADRLRYAVFDLLYLDGYDLRGAALTDRKATLAALLAQTRGGPLLYQDHVRGQGEAFRARACEFSLEGVVSKRAYSRYEEGRTRAWLKSKCGHRQEFVVGGYTTGEASKREIGALLVGYHDAAGELRFAGRVGSGLSEPVLAGLSKALPIIALEDPPFSDPPSGRAASGVVWVRPVLVAEIAFADWTREGVLRQPVFKGLRDDIEASSVVLERPVAGAAAIPLVASGTAAADPPSSAADTRKPALTKSRPVSVHGVRLTHPERLLFPDSQLTKLELARYYEAVGTLMVPHVADRPLTLVRCPHGVAEGCFYQRHLAEKPPPHVRTVSIEGMTDPEGYLAVDTLEGVLELVQLGCLEFHIWGAKASAPELPDRLVFDLDPDKGLGFDKVIDAARLLRTRLEAIGVAPFCSTTGGKGLHVVVPIVADRPWAEAETFARDMVRAIVRDHPDGYTDNMRKVRRAGAIFLDYVRNTKSSSAVAPYSTRARPGAPVAVPVGWDELTPKLKPAAFTPRAVARRIGRTADPWAKYEAARTRLTDAMLATAQEALEREV